MSSERHGDYDHNCHEGCSVWNHPSPETPSRKLISPEIAVAVNGMLCTCKEWAGGFHFHPSAVATAIREAEERGARAAVEKAAKAVCSYCRDGMPLLGGRNTTMGGEIHSHAHPCRKVNWSPACLHVCRFEEGWRAFPAYQPGER